MRKRIGKTSEKSLNTRCHSPVSSSLTSAKRFSSYLTRANALMTRMPPRFSRMSWLMRSVRACTFLNNGMAERSTTNRNTNITGRITASEMDSFMSCRNAMMMPPMAIMGANSIMVRPMASSIWTCWTSFVLRVMSEGAPKRLISLCDRLCTLR